MSTRPLPRFISWLLRRAAGPLAEEVEGDLYEWMARWHTESGPARAWLRGLATAMSMMPRLVLGRALGAARAGTLGSGVSLDVKLALRLMWRNPALSLISVVALAVTMGLTTSLFTLTTASLYTDLPVPDGDRIVAMDLRDRQTRDRLIPTYGEYRAWAAGTSTMDRVGGFAVSRLNLGRDDVPVQAIAGAWLTPSIFDFVPTTPLLGTLFSDEMIARTPEVAILGEEIWVSLFGSDPDIVGQYVDVNGVEHQIVGVIPGDWRFPADEHLWVPLPVPETALDTDQHPGMRLVGRLAESVSASAASVEANALISSASPIPDRDPQATARPFVRGFSDPAQVPLFWAAVGALMMLVLVAAANVANLILARTEARRSELAVRSALGASRRRIVGQLFLEALALTGLAALIAVTLSGWGLGFVRSKVPGLPYYMELSPDLGVWTFAATLAALAAVLAGVVPALRTTRNGVVAGIRNVGDASFGRFSQVVIVAEIAVSVALLGGAFAMGQSFMGYTRGSTTELADEEIVTAMLYTPWHGEIAEEHEIADFAARLRESIREQLSLLPGVEVGFTLDLPGTEAQSSRVEVEGDATIHAVRGVSVEHGFFEVVDVDADVGRVFHGSDFTDGAGPSFLVNEPFVEDVLQGRNAVGQRIRFHYGDGTQGEWGRVLGVIPDLGMNPGDATAAAAVYRAMPGTNYANVVARGTGIDPFALVPELREAAFRFDPRVQVREPRLLRDAARDQRALLSGFGAALFLMGGIALLLSAAGLYAVISFGVARRTREIGVRVALGADSRRIIQSIGFRVGRNLLFGLVLGLGLGWAVLQGVGVLEFTIQVNPVLHLGVPALLLVLAGAASVGKPLMRALAIQPAEALRAE